MTLQDAISTIKGFGNAFENQNEIGIARYKSWLPCPKEDIIISFKLIFAHLIEQQQLSQKKFNELMVSLMAIDSFIDDQQAKEIDTIHQKLANNTITSGELKLYSLYMKNSFTSQVTVDQMVEFVNLIRKLDPQDTLFLQKVCTYAGVDYNEEIEESFKPLLI